MCVIVCQLNMYTCVIVQWDPVDAAVFSYFCIISIEEDIPDILTPVGCV